MQKLMGDEGWGGGGPCFSLLTPSVCGFTELSLRKNQDHEQNAPACVRNPMLDEILWELRQRFTQHMNSVGPQHIAICQQHQQNQHWIHLGFLVSCWWVNLSSVYNKIYSLPRLTLDWLIFAKIFVISLCLHEYSDLGPWVGGGGG